MMAWSRAGSRSAETLLLMSLHMDSNIQALLLASFAFIFGTDLCRAEKSLPSLVGVVRVWRGSCVIHSKYLVCPLRGALCRHPITM